MSYEHNLMAHRVSAQLLTDLRSSTAPWAGGCLTSKSTLWQGVADWPRPDIAFQDPSNSASVAIEFKPPNQPKREYITGLGQALTYLNDFRYAGLILPRLANDGFQIAEYLAKTHAALLSQTSLAILAYDKDPVALTVLHALIARAGGPTTIPKGIGGKVFWGYWRDLSNHDLLTMLRLIDAGVPNFDAAFTKFWTRYLVKGRARTWEDKFRKKKKPTAHGKTGEGLNIQLAVRHAGWVDSRGRLTEDGLELLQIGKVYGADSLAFLEKMARDVLTNGRHLELIFWIDEQQRLISSRRKRNANSFYRALDLQLSREGIISAPSKTAAKAHFIRDEPKLWNKLGFVRRTVGHQYFHAGQGLVFDWRKIISVLETK